RLAQSHRCGGAGGAHPATACERCRGYRHPHCHHAQFRRPGRPLRRTGDRAGHGAPERLGSTLAQAAGSAPALYCQAALTDPP
ncbi:hypothetical protein ABTE34_20070, partial [Acinetobacter baumannii]